MVGNGAHTCFLVIRKEDVLTEKASDNPLERLLGKRLLPTSSSEVELQSLGYKGFRNQRRQGSASYISRAASMAHPAVLSHGQVLKIQKAILPLYSRIFPSFLPSSSSQPCLAYLSPHHKISVDGFRSTMGTGKNSQDHGNCGWVCHTGRRAEDAEPGAISAPSFGPRPTEPM